MHPITPMPTTPRVSPSASSGIGSGRVVAFILSQARFASFFPCYVIHRGRDLTGECSHQGASPNRMALTARPRGDAGPSTIRPSSAGARPSAVGDGRRQRPGVALPAALDRLRWQHLAVDADAERRGAVALRPEGIDRQRAPGGPRRRQHQPGLAAGRPAIRSGVIRLDRRPARADEPLLIVARHADHGGSAIRAAEEPGGVHAPQQSSVRPGRHDARGGPPRNAAEGQEHRDAACPRTRRPRRATCSRRGRAGRRTPRRDAADRLDPAPRRAASRTPSSRPGLDPRAPAPSATSLASSLA